MNKFYWLLTLFILGGFLLFPEASWGWILLVLGVGIFIGGAREAQDSPIFSLGGVGALVLGLLVVVWAIISLGGEGVLNKIFDDAPTWVFFIVGVAIALVISCFRRPKG